MPAGELTILNDHLAIRDVVSTVIGNHYRDLDGRPLQILEAGCGRKWGVDTPGVEYTLTGVEIDEDDLRVRTTKIKDLDRAIVGDLRTVELEEGAFDVIYNSFVLEHVAGAEQVLENFVRWLRPGGIIILKLPDRNTSFGFITRMTPLGVHQAYETYLVGRNRKQVHKSFPVVYDKVVSREGIRAFCQSSGLDIKEEYGITGYFKGRSLVAIAANTVLWLVHAASFGALKDKHSGMVYVLAKP